jgi:hypothetical protein
VINYLFGVKISYKCEEIWVQGLLGKLSILKADDEFDETSGIGKKMARTIELNEIEYTEFILSIDVKACYGTIAFYVDKGYKRKGHPDGKAVISWENLKTKYKTISACFQAV